MNAEKGFYDLCVPYNKDHKELTKILKELHDYGYRTVAIEQIFDHTSKTEKSSDIFPEPVAIDTIKSEFKGKLQIIHRLTIIYSDAVVVHPMNNSKNIKKFNLIAGIPKTDAAFQHCCSTFNGDIISMNLDDSIRNYYINHKYFQLAIRRGMFFEIPYALAIVDSTKRKEIMTIAVGYASQRRAKNIILSSGATNKFQVRGPYDIANLGLIFGLSEEQSKAAISLSCRKLLLKANARRYGKTIMFVKNIGPMVLSSSDEEENEEDMSEKSSSDDDIEMDGHALKKKKIS